MKNSVLSVLILAGVAACSDSISPSGGAGPTARDKAKASIIENEDLTPGLRGIDADNNGIRDDIDRLIAKKYSASPEIKKAAQQYARTLRRTLHATTRAQALADGNEIGRAVACIFKVLPARTSEQQDFRGDMLNGISALTANTKERFTTKWKVESLGGAAVYKSLMSQSATEEIRHENYHRRLFALLVASTALAQTASYAMDNRPISPGRARLRTGRVPP